MRRGINGDILVFVSHLDLSPQVDSTLDPIPTSMDEIPILPNIFLAFAALPHETPDDPLYAFPIVDNKVDTLTQSQMLKVADRQHFIDAQPKEIKGLIDIGVFEFHPMSSKPREARLLSSIWSYRRKQSPTGKILKYKARICVDGSQQTYGRNYWEVCAPVVSWPTIHLMLLLSSILDLKQRQVDYTQAFPQAPLTDPVYMRLPQGWYIDSDGHFVQHSDPTYNNKTHYIKLQRNLYGCKQAAHNWFKHRTQGLLWEGFKQSAVEPCLFLRVDCLLIVYTDDCIIFSREDPVIDGLILNLSQSFLLEDQGSVHDY
jgi:hypothetical protein